MQSIVNQNVRHLKFGNGKIIEEQLYRIDIDFGFGVGVKRFLFPDAFEKFLKLENDTLQKECIDLLIEKKEEKAREEAKKLEQERIEEELRLEESASIKKRSRTTRTKSKVAK